MTMGQFADYLFGADNPTKVIEVISRLFAQPLNRFSYQFADIVDIDDKAAGIMISYPGRKMNRLGLSMGKQLWSIYGARGFVRFVRRVLPLAFMREASTDEYFINTLAVFPDSQGQGIGTYLLSYAENKAREMHYNKCALSVEVSNLRARSLYERLGYRVVETITFDWPKQFSGTTGYHRMAKEI
jgi:ribosomal protein S18 acetylase RimI-like enzyme